MKRLIWLALLLPIMGCVSTPTDEEVARGQREAALITRHYGPDPTTLTMCAAVSNLLSKQGLETDEAFSTVSLYYFGLLLDRFGKDEAIKRVGTMGANWMASLRRGETSLDEMEDLVLTRCRLKEN